jgi:glycerophosphoryl diester phosphodiesterase
MSKVKIIGHRGAANHTENTIPSFESAIEQKVDGIELDVRASSDGQLVVIHGSVVGEHAVKTTPYETFKNLSNGYEAPLLKDVLKKFGKKTFLDIELKHDGIEEATVELIKRYCNPEKTMVSGFDADSLSKVHELLPEVQLGYIYNRTQDEEARHHCPVDVVISQFRLASRELIEEVHDEGLLVWAWTVNDQEEVRRLVNLGVDGLITDHPDKVRAWLAA